jgi:hypothetical protein
MVYALVHLYIYIYDVFTEIWAIIILLEQFLLS